MASKIPTPKTGEEVKELTDRAVKLSQDVAGLLGRVGGWDGLNLIDAQEKTTELCSILSALWQWAK